MKLRLNKCIFLLPIVILLYILNMQGIVSSTWVVFAINCVFYLIYCASRFLKGKVINALFECMIISMPVSFLSIMGSDYGALPVSWFNIFFIITIIYASISKKLSGLPWLSMVIILGIIECLLGSDLRNAINQYINILLFSLSFVIGRSVFYNSKFGITTYILLMKIISLAYAIAIIVQNTFIKRGLDIGFFDYMGGGRLSLGATFTDYSFASLFLFIGISIYLMYFGKSYLSKMINVICIILIFSANFIINARTGIMGFFIAILIYAMFMVLRVKKKAFIIITACCFLPIIFFSAIYISNSRDQSLFNGSGRLDTYKVGLLTFSQHPITGIGLGVQNYKKVLHETIPHNFIIQYLAQTGVFFTCILLAPLFVILFISYKKNMRILLSLLTMIAGGMFIPDLISSRFICLIVILYYSEKGVNERMSYNESENRDILYIK